MPLCNIQPDENLPAKLEQIELIANSAPITAIIQSRANRVVKFCSHNKLVVSRSRAQLNSDHN